MVLNVRVTEAVAVPMLLLAVCDTREIVAVAVAVADCVIESDEVPDRLSVAVADPTALCVAVLVGERVAVRVGNTEPLCEIEALPASAVMALALRDAVAVSESVPDPLKLALSVIVFGVEIVPVPELLRVGDTKRECDGVADRVGPVTVFVKLSEARTDRVPVWLYEYSLTELVPDVSECVASEGDWLSEPVTVPEVLDPVSCVPDRLPETVPLRLVLPVHVRVTEAVAVPMLLLTVCDTREIVAVAVAVAVADCVIESDEVTDRLSVAVADPTALCVAVLVGERIRVYENDRLSSCVIRCEADSFDADDE